MSFLLAAAMIAFGVPLVVWPYEVAKLEQILNAIEYGDIESEIDPDEGAATLNRVIGVLSIGVGAALLFA